jgi:hypothetical protein
MRYLNTTLIGAVVTALIVFAAGCSKDTSTGPGPVPSSASLVGTWTVTSHKVAGQELPVDMSAKNQRYTLIADSTGIWQSADGQLQSDFTWSTHADTLTFTYGFVHEKHKYAVTSQNLTLTGRDASGFFESRLTLSRQ